MFKCQKESQTIFDVWNSLPENFNELKTVAFGILTIFGSTYVYLFIEHYGFVNF